MKKIYFLLRSFVLLIGKPISLPHTKKISIKPVLLGFFVLANMCANAQPANDNCATATSLTPTAVCTPTAGTNVLATQSIAPLTCAGFTSSAALDVWYSFVATATSHTITVVGGAGFDAIVDLRSGACNGANIACADATVGGGTETINATGLTIGTTYLVRVYAWAGGTGTFTICVTLPPPAVANDLCTAAININCGQTITGTTVGATIDAVATCVTALNTAPGIWYSFTGDGQIATLSLCGSSYDTKIGIFSGTCAALTCVTGNDDGCGAQSTASFLTVAGTSYFVLVTGFGTNSGTFTLTRTCIAASVPNDLCTGAINIPCGTTITGSTTAATADAAAGTCVTALTTAPGVWYSFIGDGQVSTLSLCGSAFDTKIGIFSGTCAALTCVTGNDDFCGLQSQASITTVVGTQYYVLVTGFGTASGNFTLNRTCSSATPNDDCSGALNINCATTITGTTATATPDAVAGTCVTTLNTAPGIWYTFTGNGADITLSLCGSAYDTKIGVFTGSCAALTCVTGNDDFCGLQSQVSFTSVLGTQYYILVTGFGTAAGTFTLTRTCIFPNELCTGAIDINCGQTINGTTAGAASDAVPTCGTTLNTAPGLWYKFTGDGSPVTLSLCGSAYDTKIGVFSGSCGSFVCVGGNDDFCGTRSQVTVATTFGTQYYVLVTGFSTGSGAFTLLRTCVTPCAGAPTAGTITGPAVVCAGSAATLTLGGFTALPGISVQWKSSTVAGGPYNNITGATGSVYSFTGTGVTTYYIATVTCTNGGASASTAQFTVTQVAPQHSGVSFTVTTACSPGTVTITGTASNGGAGNYTHTLTGPGTITANAPTGANNSTGNFTVTNLPAGNYTFTLTSTSGLGCPVSTNINNVIINQTPVITFVPPAATICNGQIQQITGSVAPLGLQTFSQATTILVPAGSPTISTGNGDPYPSQITVAGLPVTGATVKSVKLGNVNHTFPDDIDVVLVSPTGQAVILMSDVGGGTAEVGMDYTFDDAAATTMADAAFNPQGTYKPTNFVTPDNFPLVGNLTQVTPTLSTFSGDPNGGWKLYVVDDTNGDFGFIGNWSITFNIPSLVTFSPATDLYSDAAATIPYVAGTPTSVVYAKPPTTTVYTGSGTVNGCSNTGTITVTVNQLPAITVQPTPAAQTICPGFNVTYSVTATGAGLTYQWKLGATNLVNNAQISGANNSSLTIFNVNTANAGSYTCVVSGTCAPPATSAAAVLTVATAPVISTAPASVTICAGANTSFTVATVGSVPAPTIYQWQVSTDAGVTWTNLLTGGSFTPTFTITGAATTLNNNRYRVLVTNNCGQTTTSAAATLTVNALPVVTATALSSKICISDTLIALSGQPAGGSWSGIGVSGFNFVPGAASIGTYTLTYSYTSTLGCTAAATVIAKVEDCQERLRLLSDDKSVIIYPNPNNGRFNIRINTTLYNYLGMKVYNSQGQLVNGYMNKEVLTSPVYSGLVYGRVIPVDLSYLPAGVYLVKLYYDDGSRTAEKGIKVVISGH